MSKILLFDWAGAVKLDKYGFQHNTIVEEDLQDLINFFLRRNLKVMVGAADNNSDYDYLMYVDDRYFSQR